MPEPALPHPQGAVAWLDSHLTQQEEALSFYQPLLGWSGEPQPDDPNRYALQRVRGKAVAGLGRLAPGEQDVPWTGYFGVTDLDTVVARISELGGRVACPATAMPGVGRFAHGIDPGGAFFALWEGDSFPGFELEGEPGCLYWLELVTSDGKAAAEFYGALLGTPFEATEMMPDSYWTVTVDGVARAGIFQTDEHERAHWRPYFQVADVDLAVAEALGAGARPAGEVQDTPFGRMGALIDPFGVEITLASPPPEGARG
jgi:predicted enzyme related to lactoylglutathione lyase